MIACIIETQIFNFISVKLTIMSQVAKINYVFFILYGMSFLCTVRGYHGDGLNFAGDHLLVRHS